MDWILKSKGVFRTLGGILGFAGYYIVPHIPAVAPFSEAFIALGAFLGGTGALKAGIAKATELK